MAEKRERLEQVVLGPGIAVYPHLHAPDTKFVKEGVYKLKLQQDAEQAEKSKAKIAKAFEKAKALVPDSARKAKVKPTRHEPWQEQEDGTFIFGEIKMRASGTKDNGETWERRPALFDSKGQRLPDGTKIGGGSTVKVAVELYPYYNAKDKTYGVALWLSAVQVIDLKTWGGASAESFGFEEEDGFTADSFPADEGDDEDGPEEDEDDGDYSAEDF